MKSEQIVSWLRDKAARAEGRDYRKMLTVAAEKIVELETELREEMHRHDRLQDFEVAEAEELRKAREGYRWIPVTERLPENFISVLGHMPDAAPFPTVRECYTIDKVFFFPALNAVHPVTHWRPMPEQPEKGTHEHDEM